LVPFRFAATIAPQADSGGGVSFHGTKSLGPFGAFQYAGVADAAAFQADYQANRWHGGFRLRRIR
jgi:hypothetical protein